MRIFAATSQLQNKSFALKQTPKAAVPNFKGVDNRDFAYQMRQTEEFSKPPITRKPKIFIGRHNRDIIFPDHEVHLKNTVLDGSVTGKTVYLENSTVTGNVTAREFVFADGPEFVSVRGVVSGENITSTAPFSASQVRASSSVNFLKNPKQLSPSMAMVGEITGHSVTAEFPVLTNKITLVKHPVDLQQGINCIPGELHLASNVDSIINGQKVSLVVEKGLGVQFTSKADQFFEQLFNLFQGVRQSAGDTMVRQGKEISWANVFERLTEFRARF